MNKANNRVCQGQHRHLREIRSGNFSAGLVKKPGVARSVHTAHKSFTKNKAGCWAGCKLGRDVSLCHFVFRTLSRLSYSQRQSAEDKSAEDKVKGKAEAYR